MKRYFLFFISLIFCQLVFPNLLYDIVDGKFAPKPLCGFYPMNDGESFALQADSATIIKCSFKTGNVVDTLFSLSYIEKPPFESIAGYEISPNEKLVMIHGNVERRYRHSYVADYYLYNIEKKDLRQLSEYGKQEAPLFSPNNRYVAFARDNNLFIRKLDFNTEIEITRDGEKNKISNGIATWVYEEEFAQSRYFEWSPNSEILAYVKFDESEVSEFSYQFFGSDKTSKEEIMLYPENVEYKYPKAGEKNPKVTVCVYEDRTRNTRTIKVAGPEEDYYVPRIKWTKSDEQLAVFKLNRNQNKLDMYFANPKSTVAKAVLSEEDKYYINYSLIDFIQFHTDNKSFIYLSERDGYRHAYKYRINGILDKQLTNGNWDITDVYGYDEKNNIFYYQSAEVSPMQRNVYALDAKGKKTILTAGKGVHNACFNQAFTYFLDNKSALSTPNLFTIRNSKGVEIVQLEDNSELKQSFEALNLPEKEFFSFTTSEGIQLNGWMLKPQDFNPEKQYPLLMIQYSGPDSQQVLDRWQIGWEYYLAQNGYVVACVDGRGTGARGAEFRKCTYQQLGVLEAKDQIEAAKYLGKQSYVDKGRIGIWGWSYGGFNVLQAMSSGQQVFKSGIAIAPVTDWRLYNTAYTERYMRRPQENFRGYETTSPLLKADKLSGELLIIHGMADDNVHVQNTMLYIDQLINAGVQFEMQLYPDRAHGINGLLTRRHLYDRQMRFLKQNL